MYEYRGIVTRIVDGDTIDINVDLGFDISHKIRIRLRGIDTPEIYRPSCREEALHGYDAKQFLINKILNKEVVFVSHKDKKGKYGRYLGDIAYTEEDGEIKLLVETMIEKGYEKRDSY